MAARILQRDKIALLSGLALFEQCSKSDLAKIAKISVETRKPAGAVLTREGKAGGVMFIIVEGEAEVRRGDRLLRKLGPGDVVGELALIDGQVRSASVRATTDVHLLEVSIDDFQSLLARSPRFVQNLMRTLSLRVRSAEEGELAGI